MASKNRNRFFLVASCVGFLFLGASVEILRGVVVPRLWDRIYSKVYESIVWLPNSPDLVMERYNGTSEVALVEVFMMNISNIERVRGGLEKPFITQIGPFVFKKSKPRRNIEWSDDREQVSFVEDHKYVFLESLSVGALNETVTTLNIPLVGVLEKIKAKYSSAIVSRLLETIATLVEKWSDAHVSGIFMTRTIGEMLQGYEDPLLSKIARFIPGIETKFGLLSSQNDCYMRIYTGMDNLSLVSEIDMWKNASEVASWSSPERVQGTDGIQFPPAIGKTPGDVDQSFIYPDRSGERRVWVPDAFRSFSLVPNETVSNTFHKLRKIHFVPDPTEFDPSEHYFQHYSGLINISSPVNAGVDGKMLDAGPKLFLSLPGFCNVDKSVSMTVDGISCSEQEEHIYLDVGASLPGVDCECSDYLRMVLPNNLIFHIVEPVTGITIEAKKSLMLTSFFGPSYSVIEPMATEDVFLPIFSLQESSKATDEDIKTLTKLQISVQLSIYLLQRGHIISSWLLGGGCITMIAYVYLIFQGHRNQHSKSQQAGEETLHEDTLEDMLLEDADTNGE